MNRRLFAALCIGLSGSAGVQASLAGEPSDNVAVVKRLLEEVWSQGKLEAAHQIVAPSYRFHSPGLRLVGPEGPDLLTTLVESRRASFPDLALSVEDVFSEGDKVAVRWTARATHSGPLGSVQPTGKKLSYRGVSIFHLAGGKIYQEWTFDDFRSVLRDLGVDRLEIRR